MVRKIIFILSLAALATGCGQPQPVQRQSSWASCNLDATAFLLEFAEYSVERGDWDNAIADYDKAIQISPDCCETYSGRGDAYRAKGDYDRAIADYNKAIQLMPDYSKAYCGRGLARKEQHKKTKAIADLKMCLERTSDPDVRKAAEQALSELGAQ